ncbi:MAG TPA: hypothetical protein VGJ05_06290 [Fimbriiglobus sp.]|jgi:hypothetical protein
MIETLDLRYSLYFMGEYGKWNLIVRDEEKRLQKEVKNEFLVVAAGRKENHRRAPHLKGPAEIPTARSSRGNRGAILTTLHEHVVSKTHAPKQ